MATALKMPQLGVTMTEATLLRWRKAVGEPVRKGEALAEIETDKLSTEVAAGTDGILRRIVAREGTVVPVAGLLGVIGSADESESEVEAVLQGRGTGGWIRQADVPAAARAADAPATAALNADLSQTAVQATSPAADAVSTVVPSGAGEAFVRSSPIARRLARERGLDLRRVTGSGPQGRILERDILAAAPAAVEASPPPVPGAAAPSPITGPAMLGRRRETIPVEGVRRVIGQRMRESLQHSAQVTLTTEADATALVNLRAHLLPAAQVYGHPSPSYTDMLVHLIARVLLAHPLLNSSLLGEGDRQEIACWADVNIGVAVALERGLVVPVVREAAAKPLDTISRELGDLIERARAGRLSMDDLQGGTFTITNLGPLEIDGFTPILNPPQCAILGVGRIAAKPAVQQEQVVIRQLVTLSLTFDHCIVDGAPAGAFLRDVKRAIEGLSSAAWPA